MEDQETPVEHGGRAAFNGSRKVSAVPAGGKRKTVSTAALPATRQRSDPQPKGRDRFLPSQSRAKATEVERDVEPDFEPVTLISQQELNDLRKTAWIPKGEHLPFIEHLEMSFEESWRRGQEGFIAVKLAGEWDSVFGPSKIRFFVMDGTDEENFLTYYTRSDLRVSWGEVSEKRGTICAMDLRDAYWVYNKKRIHVRRSDKNYKLEVLRDIPELHFDAMLVCIRDIQVQKRAKQIRMQRVREMEAKKDKERRERKERELQNERTAFRG
eukprot:GHVU01059894.1.p1 GENE.GHVU01059894.1~~GHVU01059894.1.p1  ORF type:complete len:269 (+),score=50.25 GHVU01059894.1:683-1489(+)